MINNVIFIAFTSIKMIESNEVEQGLYNDIKIFEVVDDSVDQNCTFARPEPTREQKNLSTGYLILSSTTLMENNFMMVLKCDSGLCAVFCTGSASQRPYDHFSRILG